MKCLVRLQLIIVASVLCLSGNISTSVYSQRKTTQNKTKSHKLSAREIAARVFPSVVYIQTYDENSKAQYIGSGFFVSPDLIATNYHVIEDASSIKIKIVGQSHAYPATIYNTNEVYDLALVRVTGTRGKPLLLANANKVLVGDTVYPVGNPEGVEGVFSNGIVSSLGSRNYVQITAPISHGSSGGPVINEFGQVIAVAVGMIQEGQNLNFAIPARKLRALMVEKDNIDDSTRRPEYKNVTDELSEMSDQEKSYYYFNIGFAYAYRGKYQLAIESNIKSIQLWPTSPIVHGAYYNIGFSYVQLGQYSEAIEPYKQAIKLKPNNAGYHANLGVAYHNIGQHSEAIQEYIQSIKIRPDYAIAHYNLVFSYLKIGDQGAAIDQYKILKNLDTNLAHNQPQIGGVRKTV